MLDPILDEFKGQTGSVISILQKTQDVYGFLPLDALKYIADKTGNKRAKIYGIATFYAQFRLDPVGKYVILQCQGTACHVNGSKEVSYAICDELNINPGGTTEDNMFTVEDVACLGCCSLAPVIMINGEAYGKLTPDSARKIIKDIYNKEKEGAVS
nr:NADH-quinone oxidoreductase subunit NuoE [Oxobacter pfennigii]